MTALPGVLAEIAAIAGDAAALAIADARGGTEVYIPPIPDEDHWLSVMIGRDAARAVAYRLTQGVGGRRIELPMGPVGHGARIRARVDEMLRQNRSERDICIATRYSIRGVRRRRALLKDERQLSMF